MDDLKAIVSQIGDAIDHRAAKDEVLVLIHKALRMISEREVGFIDTSGDDPSALKKETEG